MLADQLLDFFSVTHLYQQLKGYIAKDSSIVHSSGNETIAGTKTFSSTIVGSVNGTAAGLSVNSGVTAGSYGPSTDASPEAGGTITVPQVTVDEKGLVTGAANRTITFPSGGGSEEQFEKVYETTLTEDVSQPIIIGLTDLGGAYLDALVWVEFVEESALDGLRIGFLPSADTPANGIWINTVPTGDYGACVSLLSLGGLMFSTIQDTQNNGALKFEGEAYPDPDGTFQKIAAIGVAALSGGGAGTIPSGTTITVYARKQVTTPEPET